MTLSEETGTREVRRRRTEATILRCAQELFAEIGFERTTIRGVAARAGIDPALVMQHYGSKEGLFAAAARWTKGHTAILDATSDNLPEVALDDLFQSFEAVQDREAVIAVMRNCLTHPAAARIMRDEVMCDRTASMAAAIDGADAELRASLFGACVMGLAMARYLLEIEPVASASPEDVRRLLEPALRTLVDAPDVA